MAREKEAAIATEIRKVVDAKTNNDA